MSFNYFWPPEGLGIEENLPGFTADGDAIEGISVEGGGTDKSSKEDFEIVVEKKGDGDGSEFS